MKYLSAILWLFVAITFTAFCSCEPEEPTNEVDNKLHSDPVSATLLLEAGTVTNGLFTASPMAQEGQRLKSTQEITFQLQADGWRPISATDTAFFVLKGQPYRLTIRYADAKGNDITAEFATNGQDAIHQHFFRLRSFVPLLGDTLTSIEKRLNTTTNVATDALIPQLLTYHYTDTTPWDALQNATGSNITGENPTTGQLINPIGLKGWLQFATNNRRLKLQIDLMHARTSKYVNSTCSPYYQPSARQRISDHWDLQMSVPVVSLTSISNETTYLQNQ